MLSVRCGPSQVDPASNPSLGGMAATGALPAPAFAGFRRIWGHGFMRSYLSGLASSLRYMKDPDLKDLPARCAASTAL